MAADEAGTSAFEQSQILMEEFGSEANFNALMADEAKALTTPEGIEEFLKSKLEELARAGGGAALKWVSASLLRVLGRGGGGSELEQIKAMLNTILAQQKLILGKLADLLFEVKFQHLITRGYPSVQQIDNLQTQLGHLSNVVNPDERNRRAAELRAAITDVNGGTTASLKVISDVLLGKDPMGVSDPLIRLFTSRWQPIFLGRQLAPDTPLSTYWRRLDEWLHGLFVVQYIGMSQLANARVAAGDFETLKQEIADTTKNMALQRAMLNEAIPQWTRTLPASLTEGRRYLVRGPHMHAGRWDISRVLYGGRGLGFVDPQTRRHFPREAPNAEIWLFQKRNPNGGPNAPNAPNDCFFLRQGPRDRFVAVDRGKVDLRPYAALLRLVMAPTNGRQGWGSEPFVPALGLVGASEYLYWQRKDDKIAPVLAGGLDRAAIIQIVPAP
jgi:hypothetical protein